MRSTSPIGAKALILNSALSPLSFLIGEWTTTGTHPERPGKTLRGRTSFTWHEGGAFLIMRSEVDDPDFPDGVAIIGSDNSATKLAMTYFDERGVSRLMSVSVADRSVIWRHDDPKFAQMLTITAEGNDRLVSEGRMSKGGGVWSKDLSQQFERR